MRVLMTLLMAWCCLSSAERALAGVGAAQRIAPRAADHALRGTTRATKSGAGSSGWMTVAGSLMVVVVLILGLSKMLRTRGLLTPAGLPWGAIDLLGKRTIDHRHTVYLVRCGSRLLVLGASQAGLTTLSEITDSEEVESLCGLCQPSDANARPDNFGDLLGRFRAEPFGAKPTGREVDPTILRLRERLATVQPATDGPVDPSAVREGAG